MIKNWLLSVVGLAAVLSPVVLPPAVLPVHADPTPSTTASKKRVSLTQFVHGRIAEILATLKTDGDFHAAKLSLQDLFDLTIRYSPLDRIDALRDADFHLRLISQLEPLDDPQREPLLPYLLQHPVLAQTMVFLIRPDAQRPQGAYELLDTLRQKRGKQLDRYASLAAAVCAVHGTTRTIHVNENLATSADPLDIFDYYIRNEGRMQFGIQNVPAELLIYVVDTTASIPEMEWALKKYGGDNEVGKLFFSIKYDYQALLPGGKKKLTLMGFGLMNILQYGGVCVDQAYFATTVGKSIGVPSAMDSGTSGEAGHAWAGYLQSRGSTAWWNFDNGRYEAFKGVQGRVQDPQTRQSIPDSYVMLLGEMISTRAVDRQDTVVLTDAALRLKQLDASDTAPMELPADAIAPSTILPKPRPRTTDAQLQLVEAALHQSLAYTPAWFAVRDLAIEKKLSLADKRHWYDLLVKVGVKKYPDFTLAMLLPMVQTIDDPQQQDALWNNMLPLFSTRMDLTASIRMAQASLWEAQHQNDRAGQCYMDVINRFANDGPFVIKALIGAEKQLRAAKRDEAVPDLYAGAWNHTKRPPKDWSSDIASQSNWFKIGSLYAARLAQAGDAAKAADVRSQLGIR